MILTAPGAFGHGHLGHGYMTEMTGVGATSQMPHEQYAIVEDNVKSGKYEHLLTSDVPGDFHMKEPATYFSEQVPTSGIPIVCCQHTQVPQREQHRQLRLLSGSSTIPRNGRR
jgi:hypothetical protein